ncbi:hypothetical protein U1Q18_013507 [Sarracenia purpurea var. burkii]
MAYKARACSNSLYFRRWNRRNHHHLHLLIVLLLASLSFTIANHQIQRNPSSNAFQGISGDPFADDDDDDFEPAANGDLPPPNESGNSDFPPPSGGGNKECVSGTVEFHCQCPAVCDCPLTLEPKDFVKLRENLAPVIRERLTGLLKKALTIESAKEAAHSIDLLKLLNESNPELNTIRDVVHKGAQDLADAFGKIPNYIYY